MVTLWRADSRTDQVGLSEVKWRLLSSLYDSYNLFDDDLTIDSIFVYLRVEPESHVNAAELV